MMDNIFPDTTYFLKGKKDHRIKVPVSQIKKQETDILGLFFSRYNCKPCHQYYPKLIKWYTHLNSVHLQHQERFEILFIQAKAPSVESFDDLFDTMPWLALPLDNQHLINQLSVRYGVIGVPSLVLINPRNGRTVSYNASDYVDKYPNGEGFPWPDISFVDTLKGDYFQKLDKLGETNYKLWTQRDICKFKTVILYFLRGDKLTEDLTYSLMQLYSKVNERDCWCVKMIVFTNCSSYVDYDELIKDLPLHWLSLPYGLSQRYTSLCKVFEVSDFPTTIILDTEKDDIVHRNFEGQLKLDPDGKEFPWYTTAVNMYDDNYCEMIQESPGLMWFTNGVYSEIETAVNTMLPFAAANNKDTPSLWFLIADTNEEQVQDMIEILNIKDQSFPLLTILDFTNETTYLCPSTVIDEESVESFIESFKKNTLNTRINMNI